MRRRAPFGLVFVCLAVMAVSARADEVSLHQPLLDRQGLVLETAPGHAVVNEAGGRRRTIAVRKTEFLTTIAETGGGWTAAGVREVRDGSELLLIRRSSAGLQRLDAPPSKRHDLRLRPTLLADGRALKGIAWLEGTDLTSLSVRSTTRSDGEWGEIEIVAPPAKGSQTGLVGVELADGSSLLVWSAFDGRDDDLRWSQARHGRWSVARALGPNNAVPDVSPTLVATGNGALLAWSRLVDGHYQVMMSRYDGATWSSAVAVGPPGSIDAQFLNQNGSLLLLYQHAWPAGWAVADLAPNGSIDRFAVASRTEPGRPVVLTSSSRSVDLRWPDRGEARLEWEGLP